MTPDDAARVTKELTGLPVLVVLREPAFARYLTASIKDWLSALGRSSIDLVALELDEIRDLKAGGLVQPLVDARARGEIGAYGFVGETANDAEWLALNTSGRFVMTSYGLENQTAAYRALATASEYGMAVISESGPEGLQADPRATAFALAQAAKALPIRTRLLPAGIKPMSPEDCDEAWASYALKHPEPEKLPRGRPPASTG